MLVCAVESFTLMDERAHAAAQYPALLQTLATGCRLWSAWCSLMETNAGISAGCGENWSAAEAHFERALQQCHEIPHRLAEPETLRWYAHMLLARRQDGDAPRAQDYLTRAIDLYDGFGMARHAELARALITTAG